MYSIVNIFPEKQETAYKCAQLTKRSSSSTEVVDPRVKHQSHISNRVKTNKLTTPEQDRKSNPHFTAHGEDFVEKGRILISK